MKLTNQARLAWLEFLGNQANHGHLNRQMSGADIEAHVQACWNSSLATAKRVQFELPDITPKRILEIGSSTGLNCFALQHIYPSAEVIGIEPEQEAVKTATSLIEASTANQPTFLVGFGEDIPLESSTFDLIICHTVIEHVANVGKVISEASRLLSKTGILHLEAPNYIWPHEPHLNIWTIPLLGKGFVGMTAKLLGKAEQVEFLEHLKFVTPFRLEHHFRASGLKWENRVQRKFLDLVDNSNSIDIKRYRMAAVFIGWLGKLRIGTAVAGLLVRAGLYPSVMYTLQKEH